MDACLLPRYRKLRQVREVTIIGLALGPTPALLALVQHEHAQELAAWEGNVEW